MLKHIKRFMQDEEGATAVEYGLIVALIAVVLIVALTAFGDSVSNAFTDLAATVDGVAKAPE